jgi:hypothetical protein
MLRASEAIEGALEVLRLVGADRDELLPGIFGGKSMVRTEREEPSDSESVLRLTGWRAMNSGSLNLEDADKGAAVKDLLRFDRLLLVDLRDGDFEDLVDDLLVGMTTTGIPPSFRTSRIDFALELVLLVPFDTTLSCLLSGNRPRAWCRGGLLTDTEFCELPLKSRRPICFLVCRRVFLRTGGTSTTIASTIAEVIFERVETLEKRRTSGVVGDSGSATAGGH